MPARWSSRRQPALRLAANCGRPARRASRGTRRLFSQAVFDRIEVCDRELASVSYQASFDLLVGAGRFEYEAVVAHTLSWSDHGELAVRVAALAKAPGWTPEL
jgi:hypothetical protein